MIKHNSNLNIYPIPKCVEENDKRFNVSNSINLNVLNNVDEISIKELKKLLGNLDINVNSEIDKSCANVFIGQGFEDENIKDTIANLDIDKIDEIKDEGYVIDINNDKKNSLNIVLIGKDSKGTFYAVQTLKQILNKDNGEISIPEVKIIDYPEFDLRGSIEGFYGKPWSHKNRLDQLDFYGKYKMNMYIYSPKDDAYLREKWTELYPEEELNKIKELSKKASENHVTFVYALSPGLSIKLNDGKVNDEHFDLLMKKSEQIYNIGIKSFALFLDDISNKDGNSQADLINRYQKEFIEKHECDTSLIVVATEYNENCMYYKGNIREYTKVLSEKVDKDVIMMWTGDDVVSKEIKKEDANSVSTLYQNDLFLWHNYPVNDMMPNKLFMGPATGLDVNIKNEDMVGLVSNPMCEAEASKIPLFTIADYCWNPKAYDTEISWENAIKRFEPKAYESLKIFCDCEKSSMIKEEENEELKNLINKFYAKYESNDALNKEDEEYKNLLEYIKKIRNVSKDLRKNIDNEGFLEETDGYLTKLQYLGEALENCLETLYYIKNKEAKLAVKYALIAKEAYNNSEKTNLIIGDKVIVPFIKKSLGIN